MPSLISSSYSSSPFSIDNYLTFDKCPPPSPSTSSQEEYNSFDPRDLEAAFCRDFSCCGLILDDLHDLLQHYEEEHVRFEEDQGASFGDLYSPLSPPSSSSSSPSLTPSSSSSSSSPSLSHEPFPFFAVDPWNPTAKTAINATAAVTRVVAKPALKINTAVYPASSLPSPVVTPACTKPSLSDVYSEKVSLHAEKNSKNVSAFNNSVLRAHDSSVQATIPNIAAQNPKKRSFETAGMIPSAAPLQLRPLPAPISTSLSTKKLTFYSTDNAALPTPPLTPVSSHSPNVLGSTSDDNVETCASPCSSLDDDACLTKPFRCPISSCEKTYKSLSGLKYHTAHSHPESFPCTTDIATPCCEPVPMVTGSVQKPYRCKVGECGKRYKNLNGLKYHIEHRHVLPVVGNSGSVSA